MAAPVPPRRYLGLVMPRTACVAGVLEEAYQRRKTGTAPQGTVLQDVLERQGTSREEALGVLAQYVVVEQDGESEMLPVVCTDLRAGRVRYHHLWGEHEHHWAYGGHGPMDTAFSLLVDAGNADPLPLARGGVPLAVLTIKSFLERLAPTEEWCLLDRDLQRLDGFDIPPRW